MTSLRFPRSARVRARGDFDRVFKAGRRAGLPVLALHWHRTGTEPGARLGLAVSRKVDPHAVGRNRIKRCLREAFRHLRDALAPGDYVVVARPGAAAQDSAALVAAFHDLLRRAGALERAAVGDSRGAPTRAAITCDARRPRAQDSVPPSSPASRADAPTRALPPTAPAGTLAPASPTPPADAPPAPPAEPACP